MIFLAKNLRYDTPPEVMDHMMQNYHKPVPFDKDLFIIEPGSLKARRVEGDMYFGNIYARAK